MDVSIKSRLHNQTYVDYAGASLHCDAQSNEIAKILNRSLISNPHSTQSFPEDSEARNAVLKLLNADATEYAVVWTSGATAALKLVGENFFWATNRIFAYHGNVHNSVLGIREYAKRNGSSFRQLLLDEEVHDCGEGHGGLFALSAQCNFSGEKPDFVKMTREMQEKHWFVCLDAAAFCSTSPLDLRVCPADFVCLSFYKIFGLPSGLGALIARRDSVARCFHAERSYFGGGTVEACAASEDFVALRKDLSARFEDGTSPFLSIATLHVSFDLLASLGGMESIQRHAFGIAEYFARQVLELRHYNGHKAFVLYGSWANMEKVSLYNQGATVAFNGVRADGTWIGYSEIGKLASLHRIILRTGCFCNAGACQRWLGLSASQLRENLKRGHICWDDHDVIEGTPTGAVRVSFGWASTRDDAEVVLEMLKSSFVETGVAAELGSPHERGCDAELRSLWLYPVKSFGGMQVRTWEIGPRGLCYDREWAVVDETGSYLNQKSVPAMCRVFATVDLEEDTLVLNAQGLEPLILPIDPTRDDGDAEKSVIVCGDSCRSISYGSNCSAWLERVLGRPCVLVRMVGAGRNNTATRGLGGQGVRLPEGPAAKIAFANEAQFLVISEESLAELQSRLSDSERGAGDATRFRANFVVGGHEMRAHAEDEYQVMVVNGCQIFRNVGPCARCEMVCIDAATLCRSREPLRTLASYRRAKGKIFFGSLFAHDPSRSTLASTDETFRVSVGDKVQFK